MKDDPDQIELRAILRAIGIKRHGDKWKIRMAEELGCTRGMITHWDKGNRNIIGMAEQSIRRMARANKITKSDIDAQLLVDTVNK